MHFINFANNLNVHTCLTCVCIYVLYVFRIGLIFHMCIVCVFADVGYCITSVCVGVVQGCVVCMTIARTSSVLLLRLSGGGGVGEE